MIIAVSGHSLLAGFAALFLVLLGVAAVTPALLRALALAGARAVQGSSAVARLALLDIAGSLSRTGVAVAALGMALTAMIGVAVMVESFRESLREWLVQSMHADVYVSAPGPSGNIARRLDPEVVRALLATPGRARAQRGAPRGGRFPARGDRAERAAPGARQRGRVPPDAGRCRRRPGSSSGTARSWSPSR